MLDVADTFTAAMRLYEANGWRRIGRVTPEFPSEEPFGEFAYLAETGR